MTTSRTDRNFRRTNGPLRIGARLSRLPAALFLVACGAARVAAIDIGDYAPNPPTNDSAAPRYLNQQPAEVRPLEASQPQPFADAGASRYHAPEPVISGGGEFPATVSSTAVAAPQKLDANRALPLDPPSTKERNTAPMKELPPLVTAGASLGIVLGLFLLVVWVVRRGMPKGAGSLPSEAVEILGRTPFVGRQQVHLVRCGNKLLLVCASATSVHTLTEITDAAEVERLTELCQPGARCRLAHAANAGAVSARRRAIAATSPAARRPNWILPIWKRTTPPEIRVSKIRRQIGLSIAIALGLAIGLFVARLARTEEVPTASAPVATAPLADVSTAGSAAQPAPQSPLDDFRPTDNATQSPAGPAQTISQPAPLPQVQAPPVPSLGALPQNGDERSLGAPPVPAPFELPGGIGGPEQWTSPEGLSSALQMLILLGVVSLAPAILMMTTCFVRIIVVLGLLRQALGTSSFRPAR